MNKTHRNILISSACMGALLLSACSNTPVAPISTTSVKTASPQQPEVKVEQSIAASTPAATTPSMNPLDASIAISKNRSVYFDFDKYLVKPEFMQALETHGKYLAANPKAVIKIEGNTDEQGGTEYNLALGQKRADAVAKVLRIYGVRDAQLEAISFGKEKPKSLGHDDESRAQNRRADLVYPNK